MSDIESVERLDLLDCLLPRDVVIADWGFTWNNYARMALADAKTPLFTKEKSS